MDQKPYPRLLLMAVLSFGSMYVLMYAMVDTFENVFANLNQVYMAGLMAAPMVIIEVAVMRGMYPDRKLNFVIIAGGLVALVAFGAFIRRQTAISDRQFLRSMIPHHASAVLMCEKASIEDPRVGELCTNIISSQTSEIRQMRALLKEPR